ncbi:hypothetical protein [Brevundimonas lenta]|uniref:DUF4402 domain-containing protein n=1 Tax=Brevundimonas lenta TaxID=424796 RepID=A0A7W6JFP1_9CAUL|nr:hypothetical protein [Brevundimonas lenta]MBB4084278.1 hypothetical protein [Brevundimonas lenta]
MRIPLLIVAALLLPTAAAAQSARSTSSLTIENSLQVATTAPVRLKVSSEPGFEAVVSVQADAPAIIMVGGDPNRVYRVRIPNGGAVGQAHAFRIVSDNGGDISTSGVSRLDSEGRDRLEITGLDGLLSVTDEAASFPLSIVYE